MVYFHTKINVSLFHLNYSLKLQLNIDVHSFENFIKSSSNLRKRNTEYIDMQCNLYLSRSSNSGDKTTPCKASWGFLMIFWTVWTGCRTVSNTVNREVSRTNDGLPN